MKFLNYIEKQFARVLAVDTEFILDTTKTIPESVICFYSLFCRSDTCARLQAELHDKEGEYRQARDRVEKDISALKSNLEDIMEQVCLLIQGVQLFEDNLFQ